MSYFCLNYIASVRNDFIFTAPSERLGVKETIGLKRCILGVLGIFTISTKVRACPSFCLVTDSDEILNERVIIRCSQGI